MNSIALIAQSNIKPHLKQSIMKDIVNNQVNKDTCKTFNLFGYAISFKKLVKL